MPSNLIKKIIVCSTKNSINKSKIYGKLELCDINRYQIIANQLDYIKNISNRENIFNTLQTLLNNIQYNSNNITNNIKAVLPNTPYYIDDNGNLITGGGGAIIPINPVANASNFTVTNIIQESLFGIGTAFDMYKFTISDFQNAYSDNNDNNFFAIKIYRNDLDDMSLRYLSSPTTGNVFGENNSSITILKSDIPKWSLYTSSISNFIHNISFKFIDLVNNNQIESNVAILTVDRSTVSGNQPATIGDNTISVNNREVKVLTLAMFTTNLTPPYNDPEGDLIDAIRLDEISTANKGKFYLNGIEVVTNQIITREDINAGLFTYEAPNQNDIWSDAFNFSARDEGSQIWVN